MTSVVVMTCTDTQARLTAAERLTHQLDGAALSIDGAVADYPSALRGFKQALQLAVDNHHAGQPGSHVCVVQDDAVPLVPGIRQVIDQVAFDNRYGISSLYVGTIHAVRRDYHQAQRERRAWVPLPIQHYVPTLASVWPVDLAEAFLFWVDRLDDRTDPWDDEAVMRWRRWSSLCPASATIPCYFGHDNMLVSAMGHQHHGTRKPMMTPPRARVAR